MRQIVQLAIRFGAARAAAVVICALGAYPASASTSSGCLAVNRGELDLDVPGGQGRAREIALDVGDALQFSITTPKSASIVLTGGAGAPRTLYTGPGTSSVAFSAKAATAYAFQFTADSATATLRARCTSVADAAARSAFLTRRNDLLTAQEPDRIRIDRPNAPPISPDQSQVDLASIGKPKPAAVSISVSELAAAATPGAKAEPSILDFWLEGRFQPYETTDVYGAPTAGNLGVMYVGSKYMIGPDIMVGALAQLDRADETASKATTEVSAGGWMAGPYASVRFGPGVIFDGRMAWGESDSGVAGLAVAPEKMDRSLVRGTLRGTRQLGPWTLAPTVGLSYLEDTPKAHAVSPDQQAAVPGAQGRIEVLPEVKRRFDVNSETYVEPRAAVGGFLSFDNFSQINPNLAVPDLHVKAEAGVAVGIKDGMNLEAKAGVETGGEAQPDNWSGGLQLNMPLGK